jgi:hypothetical protein
MNQQFQVRWPNGQTTVEVSHNSETPTAYAMERWGCNSLEDLAALGVDIKMPSTEHEQIEETEMKGESAPKPRRTLTTQPLAEPGAAAGPLRF